MSETNGHSKHYQVPKANHPWRRYKDRTLPFTEESQITPKVEKLPDLKSFLEQIVENWDSYKFPTNDVGDAYVKINKANPKKSAEWLADFLRKTWVKQERGIYIDGI